MVYDEDTGLLGVKKDLLGRIWIDLERLPCKVKTPKDHSDYELFSRSEPKWYDLIFEATQSKEGRLLVGYDLIPLTDRILVIHISSNNTYSFHLRKLISNLKLIQALLVLQ